jgi:hypothetical protein
MGLILEQIAQVLNWPIEEVKQAAQFSTLRILLHPRRQVIGTRKVQ